MKNNILDEYDCRMIRHFKRSTKQNPVSVKELLTIWGDRCEMDADYWHLEDILSHLSDLAEELNLFRGYYSISNFLTSLSPERNWEFVATSNPYTNDMSFEMILLSRLDSLFTLTTVDKLPGYKAYCDSLGDKYGVDIPR